MQKFGCWINKTTENSYNYLIKKSIKAKRSQYYETCILAFFVVAWAIVLYKQYICGKIKKINWKNEHDCIALQ